MSSQRVEGRLVIHPVEEDDHAFRLVDHCLFSAIFATTADIISAIAADIWSRAALSNGVFNRSPPRLLVEAALCVQLGVEATETDVRRNHGLSGPIVLPSAHSHHGNVRPGKRLVDVWVKY
jgi:hypothetical protein